MRAAGLAKWSERLRRYEPSPAALALLRYATVPAGSPWARRPGADEVPLGFSVGDILEVLDAAKIHQSREGSSPVCEIDEPTSAPVGAVVVEVEVVFSAEPRPLQEGHSSPLDPPEDLSSSLGRFC